MPLKFIPNSNFFLSKTNLSKILSGRGKLRSAVLAGSKLSCIRNLMMTQRTKLKRKPNVLKMMMTKKIPSSIGVGVWNDGDVLYIIYKQVL